MIYTSMYCGVISIYDRETRLELNLHRIFKARLYIRYFFGECFKVGDTRARIDFYSILAHYILACADTYYVLCVYAGRMACVVQSLYITLWMVLSAQPQGTGYRDNTRTRVRMLRATMAAM